MIKKKLMTTQRYRKLSGQWKKNQKSGRKNSRGNRHKPKKYSGDPKEKKKRFRNDDA